MAQSALPVPARCVTSFATVSPSDTLPEKLQAAAAVGFDGVEIFENDLLTFDGSPQDVRSIADRLGLAITIFQPFRDFEAMPEPQRSRNLDRAERKFDIMQALGTDLVLVCSNVQPAVIDDDARAAADLAEMAERARRRGLRIGYEALAWGRHVNRWRHAWKIVGAADHAAAGLVVDCSTRWRPAITPPVSVRLQRTSCSSCSSLMRCGFRWTRSPAAGISAISLDGASCLSGHSSATSLPPDLVDHCRSRTSPTSCAQRPRG